MANLAVLSGPEQRQAQATGVATAATPMDLPLITEATSDYYRNIYADPDLGPIFKGVNMVVLRQHVSYFLHQLAMFDAPLTPRQLDYLRRVHVPVIMAHRVTQKHYDAMVGYLMKAMVANGAEVSEHAYVGPQKVSSRNSAATVATAAPEHDSSFSLLL
jgi:truncated hemoglobin YjbI